MADDLNWHREADAVVLGSGGAALTAAIAAYDFGAKDVVILEKSGMVGGTTAMSGGMLWIPTISTSRIPASKIRTMMSSPISMRSRLARWILIRWAPFLSAGRR